jgi:hypothetical protein
MAGSWDEGDAGTTIAISSKCWEDMVPGLQLLVILATCFVTCPKL